MHLSKWWVSLFRGGQTVPADSAAYLQICSSAIDEVFSHQGFERVDKRRWVNSSKQPLRHVLKLQALKGACEALTWGASFDFAPVVDTNAMKIRWCRTPKSARQMLIYDPMNYWDRNGKEEWRIGEFFSRSQNDAVTAKSISAASEWFAKVKSLEDAVTEFEDWQQRPSTRFGYQNYVMARLYHAFCLARVNRTNEAIDLFQSWVNDEKVTDVEFVNKLRALLLAAPQSK